MNRRGRLASALLWATPVNDHCNQMIPTFGDRKCLFAKNKLYLRPGKAPSPRKKRMVLVDARDLGPVVCVKIVGRQEAAVSPPN